MAEVDFVEDAVLVGCVEVAAAEGKAVNGRETGVDLGVGGAGADVDDADVDTAWAAEGSVEAVIGIEGEVTAGGVAAAEETDEGRRAGGRVDADKFTAEAAGEDFAFGVDSEAVEVKTGRAYDGSTAGVGIDEEEFSVGDAVNGTFVTSDVGDTSEAYRTNFVCGSCNGVNGKEGAAGIDNIQIGITHNTTFLGEWI